MTCGSCIYHSIDSRYDKGCAKCLRKSIQGNDPVMVRLNEASCSLFFLMPKDWLDG